MRTNPAIVIPIATRSTRWRSLSHAEGEQRTAIPPRTVVPSPRLADRAPCAGPSANHAIAPFPQHDVTQRRNSLSTIRRGMRTRPALSCKGSVPPRASNTEFPASQPPSMAGVLLPSFCLPSLATAAPGPARSTGGGHHDTLSPQLSAQAPLDCTRQRLRSCAGLVARQPASPLFSHTRDGVTTQGGSSRIPAARPTRRPSVVTPDRG